MKLLFFYIFVSCFLFSFFTFGNVIHKSYLIEDYEITSGKPIRVGLIEDDNIFFNGDIERVNLELNEVTILWTQQVIVKKGFTFKEELTSQDMFETTLTIPSNLILKRGTIFLMTDNSSINNKQETAPLKDTVQENALLKDTVKENGLLDLVNDNILKNPNVLGNALGQKGGSSLPQNIAGGLNSNRTLQSRDVKTTHVGCNAMYNNENGNILVHMQSYFMDGKGKKKIVQNCSYAKTVPAKKGPCEMLHDYKSKKSYKRFQPYFTMEDKEDIAAGPCVIEETYNHAFEASNCPVFINKDTYIPQGRFFIFAEGKKHYISDCLVDPSKTKTTLSIDFEDCPINHNISANVSYSQGKYYYMDQRNSRQTIGDCQDLGERGQFSHQMKLDGNYFHAIEYSQATYERFFEREGKNISVQTGEVHGDEKIPHSFKLSDCPIVPDKDHYFHQGKYFFTHPLTLQEKIVSDCRMDPTNTKNIFSIDFEGCPITHNIPENVSTSQGKYYYMDEANRKTIIGECQDVGERGTFEHKLIFQGYLHTDSTKNIIGSSYKLHNRIINIEHNRIVVPLSEIRGPSEKHTYTRSSSERGSSCGSKGFLFLGTKYNYTNYYFYERPDNSEYRIFVGSECS